MSCRRHRRGSGLTGGSQPSPVHFPLFSLSAFFSRLIFTPRDGILPPPSALLVCLWSLIQPKTSLPHFVCSMSARERCRTSPPRFLAECCKTRLNQASFVWLCFVFGIVFFSGLCLVFVVCLFLICLLSWIFRREPTWMVCWLCADVLFTHSLTTHFSPSVEWLYLSPYLLWSSVTRPHLTAPSCQRLYSVSQKKILPPLGDLTFFHFFHKRLRICNRFLHTY